MTVELILLLVIVFFGVINVIQYRNHTIKELELQELHMRDRKKLTNQFEREKKELMNRLMARDFDDYTNNVRYLDQEQYNMREMSNDPDKLSEDLVKYRESLLSRYDENSLAVD